MKFEALLKMAQDLPVVETGILLNLVDNPRSFLVQISRWEKAGKLRKLRRGMYLLAHAYRKIEIFESCLASYLVRPSYISMQKALEFHGMIPEAVAVYSSITTRRPAQYLAEGVRFEYRHVKKSLFWGYESVRRNGQTGFVAGPEKALLDMLYFCRGEVSPGYLHGLRLGNAGRIDAERLRSFARRFGSPRMLRAASVLEAHLRELTSEETPLED
jgi:predicted transcriptional regulator of viral defense system